jgi:hypothetical protein
MHIGRKLLILAIVLLFSYIIYALLQKRREIQSSLQNYYKEKEKEKQKNLEGFGEKDDPNYDAIMKDIKNISTKITYQIENDNKPIVYKNYNTTSINNNKTLKDVFMKASYNSAFTGNYLSSEMVKFCLSQGCRFLDFEVDLSGEIPYVFCKNNIDTPNPTNKTKSGTPRAILLLEVLKCTLDAAFNENSGSTYPITNINDPLFIHIRCNNATYDKVYSNVLTKLINDTYYNTYLHFDTSNKTFNSINPTIEKLSDYKRKAIIIIYCYDTANKANCNYIYNKSDAKTYSDVANSNQQNIGFQIVVSPETALDEIKPNPDVFTSVKDRNYQVTCISYSNYLKEAYLTQNERKYENMFTDFNYSYILMSELKTYINNNPLYTQS